MRGRLFPPKEALKTSVVRLPPRLWDALSKIAKAEGRSRNDVITKLLELGVSDYGPQGEKKK